MIGFPWRVAVRQEEEAKQAPQVRRQPPIEEEGTGVKRALGQFLRWTGPALMVSIAYMDPGNYGTDILAGAGFKYALLWAVWLASAMAMLLQYLSGKLGIATAYSLPELVRKSFGGKGRYVIPYWLGAEAASAATDLAEYLGTVLALNILFGVPLLYAAIFGALDVVLLLAMMTRRFRLMEQYFALLISVLVVGIFYNLFVVKPDLAGVALGSVVPIASTNEALLLVVSIVGATVMPHALYVHSWLSKNKMDMVYGRSTERKMAASTKPAADSPSPAPSGAAGPHPYSTDQKRLTNRLHRNETVFTLTIAGVVNAGILLIAAPLFAGNGSNLNLDVSSFVRGIDAVYGPLIGIVLALTLLASGLSASALGTMAGQVIMEGLIGKRWNIWIRRIVTRAVNVFPTTVAILLGLSPLYLLAYSQVVLSILIPLPMIPLVYYTSRTKFMGPLANKRATIVLALLTVIAILAFNVYLLFTSL